MCTLTLTSIILCIIVCGPDEHFATNSSNEIDTLALTLNNKSKESHYDDDIHMNPKKELIFCFLRGNEAKFIRETFVKTSNTPYNFY